MRTDQMEYWLNPTPENMPSKYLEDGGRSAMLVNVIQNKMKLEHDRSIFEIGCNVGRNFSQLEDAGYTQLVGVDINPKALDLVKAECCLMLGAIERVLPKIVQPYGLVFTMAVLQHVPPENESVFKHIARLSTNLLTIEDETCSSSRHFPRNYREVFEGLGMKHVRGWRNLIDLNKTFVMRWFKKQEIEQ